VHKSVLLYEAIEYLKCEKKKLILDCTVGAAGHAREILKRLPPGGRVIGIDADKGALEIARVNLKDFENSSFSLINANFKDFDKVLSDLKIKKIDGMLFDLGISSIQLDDESRGFTFLKSGPLDMRMDQDTGKPLWQVLRTLSERELGEIIRDLGEERYWRKIAKKIRSEEKQEPIQDSKRLAEIIRETVGYRTKGKIDPSTRTFQALRIFVNDELGSIKETLRKVSSFLNPGARVVVISFHSLEDRIVKHVFRGMAKEEKVKILTKKPITPSIEEISQNPRSRSAKLRACERI